MKIEIIVYHDDHNITHHDLPVVGDPTSLIDEFKTLVANHNDQCEFEQRQDEEPSSNGRQEYMQDLFNRKIS